MISASAHFADVSRDGSILLDPTIDGTPPTRKSLNQLPIAMLSLAAIARGEALKGSNKKL